MEYIGIGIVIAVIIVWGKKKGKELRFSKSGRLEVERKYATHFVDSKQIAQINSKK
ncbi:hypothetical protein [Enterococcus cecorum]|uniref:hypothetical protein n=1 Tax=Enterococcus cecorum TaxID=44008 RepID=UPI00148DBA6B|nr:hypothetical protein [Enterococcus cecorum]